VSSLSGHGFHHAHLELIHLPVGLTARFDHEVDHHRLLLAPELDVLLASAAENFFLFASVDESLPRPPLGLVALHASAVYYLLEGLSEVVYLAVDTQYSYLDGAGACSVVRQLQVSVVSYVHRLDRGADVSHHSFAKRSHLRMLGPMMPDPHQPIP
jgi:hypothetical protein